MTIQVSGIRFQIPGWAALPLALVLFPFAPAPGVEGEATGAVETPEVIEPLAPAEKAEDPPTLIESDRLEMQAFDDRAHFVFTGNVQVTGNNLAIQCDLMEVFSVRDETDGGAMPAIGRFQQIVATGNVRIEQEGRVATAGRADMFPIDGRIVLTDNPVVSNEHGSVSGPRIILYQGESRAVVESEPGHRPRITLPTLPDLGVDARRPSTRDERPADR